MKYTLTISDLTAGEVTRIVNQVNAPTEVETVESPLKLITSDIMLDAITQAADEYTSIEEKEPVMKPIKSFVPESSENISHANNEGVEIDANGYEWDERIHASSKSKNKDGSWKRKRGVTDEEFANIIASKSATLIAELVPAVPASALIETPTVPTPVAPIGSTAPTRDFAGFLGVISALHSAQKVDHYYPQGIVDRINNDFGTKIVTLVDIASNPNMVEYAWQCLEVDGVYHA